MHVLSMGSHSTKHQKCLQQYPNRAKELGHLLTTYIRNCSRGWDARIFTTFCRYKWPYLRSRLTDFDDLSVYTYYFGHCASNGTPTIDLSALYHALNGTQSRHPTLGDHKGDGFSYLFSDTLIHISICLPSKNPRLLCDQNVAHTSNITHWVG